MLNAETVSALCIVNPLKKIHLWRAMGSESHEAILPSFPPTLRSLSWTHVNNDNACYDLCQQCPQLRTIYLNRAMNISDYSMRLFSIHMKHLKRLVLELAGNVTDIGLCYLAGCPKLRIVSLRNEIKFQEGTDRMTLLAKLPYRIVDGATQDSSDLFSKPIPFKWLTQ